MKRLIVCLVVATSLIAGGAASADTSVASLNIVHLRTRDGGAAGARLIMRVRCPSGYAVEATFAGLAQEILEGPDRVLFSETKRFDRKIACDGARHVVAVRFAALADAFSGEPFDLGLPVIATAGASFVSLRARVVAQATESFAL